MLTVYIKASNFCALGCGHCYIPVEQRRSRDRMDHDTLMHVADLLSEAQERERHGGIQVVWHGGEPMQVPADWYYAAGEVLDAALPGHVETMQTSLIGYRHEFGELAKARFDGYLGSSYDLSHRTVNYSVEAFADMWLDNVARARDDGIVIVPTVVPGWADTDKAETLLEFLVRHEFEEARVERQSPRGGRWCTTNAEHAHFLLGLYRGVRNRTRNGQRAPAINTVREAVLGVLFGIPGGRWGSRCGSKILVVEPNGELHGCPEMTGESGRFGHVVDGPEVLSGAPRRAWQRLQSRHQAAHACHDCPHASWCRSGCPLTEHEADGECPGYRGYLDAVAKDLAGLDRTSRERLMTLLLPEAGANDAVAA